MGSPIFVRYCMSGHEVQFSGLCPSECPICGDRIDRSRAPVPLEQLQWEKREAPAAQLEPATLEVQPEPVSKPDPVPQPEIPVRPRQEPVQTVRSRQEIPERQALPVQPPSRREPIAQRVSPAPSEDLRMPVDYMALNYFGMYITLPAEGGWLGREGLGKECFEGNLYISRQHVFVKVDQNGRLLVQDDQSLNGVYYDKGAGRQKLQKNSTIILEQGELLWLYNVPLKWERRANE